MAQTKDGSLITTGIELPDAEQLVQFGGMSLEGARLVRKGETQLPGSGIIRPQGKKLPAEFAGAVLIGEPRDTNIILTGSFVTASKPGIVLPTAEDVANVNNGTYTGPKLVK